MSTPSDIRPDASAEILNKISSIDEKMSQIDKDILVVLTRVEGMERSISRIRNFIYGAALLLGGPLIEVIFR